MTEKETINLQDIQNPSEKDILMLLKKRGKCLYGEIIKELRISGTNGQEAIFSLIKKGLIKRIDKTSFIDLNVEVK
jgi:DNA-binding MarR family transcriptional regulator